MSDLIGRSKIYNYIKTQINPYGKPFEGDVYEFGIKLMEYIKNMENAEHVTNINVWNKWIPCSERLPDIDMSYPNAKDYLVYYEHGYYDVASYSNINRFWHEHTTEPYWNCEQYCKVIAWMPLPPAFKGE